MQLVHALAAGVRGAENGTALVYSRSGAQAIAYYLGDGGYEGGNQQAAGTPVALDSYGGASVYVTQAALIVVRDSNYVEVRSFVCGNYDAAVEIISPSFTGTDYDDAESGVNKPTTLERVADAWITSAGAPDFNVLSEGSATTLQAIVAALAGYLVSVKNYGALGNNIADDTTAIGNAAAAAYAAGKVLFFPPGTYRTTSAVALPAELGLLGCGPGKSIISIDHASNAIFAQTAAGGQYQRIQGLHFRSKQNHTGSLFTTTQSSLWLFDDCEFGSYAASESTLGSLAQAIFFVGVDAISPKVFCRNCHFHFPDQWAGQLIADGAFTATPEITLTDCHFTWHGEINAAGPLTAATQVNVKGCYFDVSVLVNDWTNGILGNFSSNIVAVGNRVSDTNGANVYFIHGSGVVLLAEGENIVGDGVELLNTMPSGDFQLGSRKNRIVNISQSGGGTLNLSTNGEEENILNAEVIVVTIADNQAFTISTGVSDHEGLEFELFLVNAVAGATGTITWSNTSFAGLTSVSGTVVPTSIAAQGSVVSSRFRCYNGPDGVRFYPVGGALVST